MPSDCSLPPSLARTLSRREQILDELLSHYTEAQETLNSSGDLSRGGSSVGVALMPLVWTASYQELERSLREMRDTPGRKTESGRRWKQLYWHLGEWYLRYQRVQRPRVRRLSQGRTVTVPGQYQIETVRHRDVRAEIARDGLGVVAIVYQGEPFEPACERCHKLVFTACQCGLVTAA